MFGFSDEKNAENRTSKDGNLAIEAVAEELAEYVMQRDIFKNYAKCKKIIEGSEELSAKARRAREIASQIQEISGMEGMEYEEDELSGEYERLCSDKFVNEFLQAEVELSRTFNVFMNVVMGKLGF